MLTACLQLQQPEVDVGPIPTDEATEAADTEPATAPAADARCCIIAPAQDLYGCAIQVYHHAPPHCSSSSVSARSMPQKGSKSNPGTKASKGSKPTQPKGKPDYEQAGALADWLKDAAAEMKKQGVSQKFTVRQLLSHDLQCLPAL